SKALFSMDRIWRTILSKQRNLRIVSSSAGFVVPFPSFPPRDEQRSLVTKKFVWSYSRKLKLLLRGTRQRISIFFWLFVWFAPYGCHEIVVLYILDYIIRSMQIVKPSSLSLERL